MKKMINVLSAVIIAAEAALKVIELTKSER